MVYYIGIVKKMQEQKLGLLLALPTNMGIFRIKGAGKISEEALP